LVSVFFFFVRCWRFLSIFFFSLRAPFLCQPTIFLSDLFPVFRFRFYRRSFPNRHVTFLCADASDLSSPVQPRTADPLVPHTRFPPPRFCPFLPTIVIWHSFPVTKWPGFFLVDVPAHAAHVAISTLYHKQIIRPNEATPRDFPRYLCHTCTRSLFTDAAETTLQKAAHVWQLRFVVGFFQGPACLSKFTFSFKHNSFPSVTTSICCISSSQRFFMNIRQPTFPVLAYCPAFFFFLFFSSLFLSPPTSSFFPFFSSLASSSFFFPFFPVFFFFLFLFPPSDFTKPHCFA